MGHVGHGSKSVTHCHLWFADITFLFPFLLSIFLSPLHRFLVLSYPLPFPFILSLLSPFPSPPYLVPRERTP